MKLGISLTFCGDYAGVDYDSSAGKQGACDDLVRNNPNLYSGAFWEIPYVRVFKSQGYVSKGHWRHA